LQARFDKQGRRLPDTGRGCGCQLCADADAPRYERRADPARESVTWNPIWRQVVIRLRRAVGRAELA
jgi:hypothetical protein